MRSGIAKAFASVSLQFVAVLLSLQLVVVGAVLVYIDTVVRDEVTSRQQALAIELRDDLVADYRQGGADALRSQIARRIAAPQWRNSILLFEDVGGRGGGKGGTRGGGGSTSVGNLDAWPAGLKPSGGWSVVSLRRDDADRDETAGLIATELDPGRRLLTGRIVDAETQLSVINRTAVLGALLLAVPLILVISLALGRLIDARLRAIAQTVDTVSSGDLTRRVALNGSGDAFDRLAGATNAMLARIEALVAELRLVTDGLAHDLRSPLTRLGSSLEVALATDPGPVAVGALERAQNEAAQVQRMLATSLQISRSQAGLRAEAFAPVDLCALIDDLAEVHGPAAEDRGIRIVVTCNAATTRGDRQLLAQAVSNLIENAVRYATGATRITLAVSTAVEAVTLSVADDGPGIAPAQHEEALRRFGRLDPSRSLPGSGLGLALAQEVARAHSGALRLEDARPGLRVVMSLHEK